MSTGRFRIFVASYGDVGTGKKIGFIISSLSVIPAALHNNETSDDLKPVFCGIPLAIGFITPTSMPRFRKHIANAAVITVLPTPVSVPVTKKDFTENNCRCYLIIHRIVINGTSFRLP